MVNLMIKKGVIATSQSPGCSLRRGSVTILKILSYWGWDFEMGKVGISPVRGDCINFVYGLQAPCGVTSRSRPLNPVVKNTRQGGLRKTTLGPWLLGARCVLPSVGGY